MFTDIEYKTLKNKYGSCSSWAIWDHKNPTDTKVISNNIEQLNSNYILLGLNISRPLTERPWTNFHDNTHARKLKYACNDTKLRGSYITDIFKGIPEPKSNKFVEALNSKIIEKNVNFFIQEMKDIKLTEESQFIIFGTPTSIIAKCFNDYFKKHFSNQVTYYYHYAYYTLTDKQWVEGFWEQLNIKQDYDSIISKYKQNGSL